MVLDCSQCGHRMVQCLASSHVCELIISIKHCHIAIFSLKKKKQKKAQRHTFNLSHNHKINFHFIVCQISLNCVIDWLQKQKQNYAQKDQFNVFVVVLLFVNESNCIPIYRKKKSVKKTKLVRSADGVKSVFRSNDI